MAFQIVEILDVQAENVVAKALHQDNPTIVAIRGMKKDEIVPGTSIQAEITYDEVVEWNVIDDFSDDRSGIWQDDNGIHLVGRIHNVLDYGDGKTIVDVYMQKGSEFFSVTSESMEEIEFDANTGLEIVVKTLYLHLTS